MDETTEVPDAEPANFDPVQGFEQGAANGTEFSLADAFRQDLEELVETKTVMISVRGYDRIRLQVQYHMATGKRLDEISRKVQREFKDTFSRNLYAAIDTMIDLCDGLYVQPEGADEPVILDPDESGYACQFDQTLAELMKMPDAATSNARTVVRRLFGNNDIAVLNHAERLSRWLQNAKADVELEFWQTGE